jgi:hypothetical protein
MAHEVGQRVRVPFTVRDVNGDPTDADIAVTVFRDDDTPYVGITATHGAGTGEYFFDVTVDSDGIHRWVVVASGAVVAVLSGQFFVRSPGQRIVSLEEAKKHLNKTATVTTDDDELRSWIDAATYVIEREIGAVIPRQVVESYDGGLQSIILRKGPVISVDLVEEFVSPGVFNTLTLQPDLGPFTDNQYMLNLAERRIERSMGGTPSRFLYWGRDSVRVEYTIGRQPMPANIRQGALELVAHFWRSSQFSTGRAVPREGTTDASLVGIALPNRVAALIGRKRAPTLGE